jgi:hypothetical protein
MAQERDVARERFWRRAIRRQQRGRESIRAFCQREGLAETAFHFWRRELARRDQESTARQPRPAATGKRRDQRSPAKKRGNERGAAGPLVPLTIIRGETATAAPLEFVFPSGVTLRVGLDAPWELVARALIACGARLGGEAESC